MREIALFWGKIYFGSPQKSFLTQLANTRPTASITFAFYVLANVVRAVPHVDVEKIIIPQFLQNFSSTEGALRRTMTNNDHPTKPLNELNKP